LATLFSGTIGNYIGRVSQLRCTRWLLLLLLQLINNNVIRLPIVTEPDSVRPTTVLLTCGDIDVFLRVVSELAVRLDIAS